MYNPQCIEKVPQKLFFQTFVFTLLLHWHWSFHFEDTNISDLISHYSCFFSQLCFIDLIQASLHNSCAILLVKCTPLLQVCALLGLMLALVPSLAYSRNAIAVENRPYACLAQSHLSTAISDANFFFFNSLPFPSYWIDGF